MSPNDETPNERVLDDLLSADLDGELAAAAGELGLTLEAAGAAIASPAAIARRAELARARDLVAAPVPLDSDVADRLVTTSITQGRQDNEVGAARARRERRAEIARRIVVAAGSAAAVIAVIVGLANMSPSGDDDMGAASMAPTDSSATGNPAPERPVALGDVSRDEQLRRSVQYGLRAPAPRAGSGTTARSSARPSPTEEFATDGAYDAAAKQNVAACLPATQATAGGEAPVLTGRGTSGGRPVNVYVFRSGNAYDVVVVGPDCSVVDRLSLP